MKTFIYKLLSNEGLSIKRFLAAVGTCCLCVYTFITNDPVPLTTIVITCISGNVAEKYLTKNNDTTK